MNTGLHRAIWMSGLALGALCLGLLIASLMSDRFKRTCKWSTTMAGKLAIIVAGTFFLVLPIAMFDTAGNATPVWKSLSETIPAAIYITAQVLVLQVALDTWSVEVFTFIGGGLWGHCYFWLLTFFAIACPVVLAMTAIDVVLNGLTGFAVWGQSFKKSLRCRPIYVFYGLNDNTVTLACDLLEHVSDEHAATKIKMPLLVFTNVTGEADASGESYEGQVREAASGVADVIVTPMVLEDVPEHISRRARKRCETYYLVISNDTARNVRATIRLTDTFTEELLSRELKKRGWDETHIGSEPDISTQTRSLAAHIHVWCTHENPDDDLVFDSLPHRGPSERIMNRLLHNPGGHRHKRSRAGIAHALLPLELKVRSLFEVRLIFEKRQVVWDALVEQPLTEVLDPIDLSQGPAPYQLLYVVVVGLDDVGLEAIRAAFWFGRLPGVELRILGLGNNARAALRRLGSQAPGLLAERTPTQTGDAPTPTVCLVEADTSSIDVEQIFDGEVVDGLTLTLLGETQTIPTAIPRHARVYTMVALEDDDQSIDVALRIQRTLTHRALSGRLDEATLKPRGGAHPQNPVVTLLLLDEELYDSVGHLADGEEEFPVIPFGATYRTFSFESVLAAPWEKAAFNLQAAHDSAFRLGRGGQGKVSRAEALESYNSLEVRKLSNRAAVRYAIYRLWCLGLSHGSNAHDDLHHTWLAKLGASGIIEAALGGDPTALECLCGLTFDDAAHDKNPMSESKRKERITKSAAMAKDVERRWPVLNVLAAQEHKRWCAFFRAQGWRTIDDFDVLQQMMKAVGRTDEPGYPFPHQSTRLKRHYYLVDSAQEEARRGAECRDDPCADDRLIVIETIRSLRGEVVG